MIPDKGWKPLASAPRDGTVFIVVFHEWGDQTKPKKVAHCQWGCNDVGDNWAWRAPHRVGTTQHADGWMTYQEFLAAQGAAKKAVEPEFDL